MPERRVFICSLATQRFVNWSHPFWAEERKGYPVALEAFYRSTETTSRGTWKTTYVEAIRRFPPRAVDRDCGLITGLVGNGLRPHAALASCEPDR